MKLRVEDMAIAFENKKYWNMSAYRWQKVNLWH